MNDKEKVTLTCPICHNTFEMTYGNYRRKRNQELICVQCYYANRAEKFHQKSAEEQAEWQAKMKAGYANRTPEQKAATSAKLSKINKGKWDSFSQEKKDQILAETKATKAAKSEEEIKSWKQKISVSQKNVWGQLNAEQRREKMKPVFEGAHKYWDNITEEELIRNHRLVSEGLRRYYANAKPEDNIERWRKIGQAHRSHWNSMTREEQLAQMRPIWDAQENEGPTEIDFRKLLQSEGFIEGTNFIQGFNTMDVGYEHPKFVEIFGDYNPITKSANFPYHRWDFMIITKSGPLILIDVDGSIHSPKRDLQMHTKAGVKFSRYEFVLYQDSKRPYQIPDGFIAYSIKCYDDKLMTTNPVDRISINPKDNEQMSLKDFMDLLISVRFDDKSDK